MAREEVRAAFVERIADLQEAAWRWCREDEQVTEAVHDALVEALEHPPADWEALVALVAVTAFILFQQRRERYRRFPQPRHWVVGGRHLALPTDEGDSEGDDPLNNIADDRPNPEEELIRKECEEAVNDLARRMGQDRTGRSEMYELLYVEGLEPLEAAKRLGITHSAARQRAKRLKNYLQGSREAKQIKRTRGLKTRGVGK